MSQTSRYFEEKPVDGIFLKTYCKRTPHSIYILKKFELIFLEMELN